MSDTADLNRQTRVRDTLARHLGLEIPARIARPGMRVLALALAVAIGTPLWVAVPEESAGKIGEILAATIPGTLIWILVGMQGAGWIETNRLALLLTEPGADDLIRARRLTPATVERSIGVATHRRTKTVRELTVLCAATAAALGLFISPFAAPIAALGWVAGVAFMYSQVSAAHDAA